MRTTCLACVLLLFVPALAGAQDQPAEGSAAAQPTFRTGINIVRVDVTVTGRDAAPVPDLTAEDFDVFEDGHPQRVDSVQFVRVTGRPAENDDLSLDIRSPEHAAQEAAREDVRLLVIFIDDYHLRNGALFDYQLRRLLWRFVMTEMAPTDLFALMGPLTPISDLGITRNKQDIIARINRIQGRLGGFVPPRSVIEESHLRMNPAERARVRAQITYSALQSLVVHLSGLREGRKSILFVSEGPPVIGNGQPLFDRLRDVIAAANTGNVTIHTLDPREIGAGPLMNPSNDALAAETGGRRLGASNDHTRALRAVMADASAYYLLGYSPERENADGKFHKIEVRVKRKGLRVLARKGYWAPTAAEMHPVTQQSTVPPDVTAALTALRLSERPGIVTDAVTIGPLEHGESAVTITCSEPAAARGQVAALTAEVLNADGTVLLSQTPEQAEGTWMVTLRLGSGVRKVRLTARDVNGEELDSWIRQVDVPAADHPAADLGTPIVLRARTPSEYVALTRGGDAPAIPSRQFRRGDHIVVRIPVASSIQADSVRAELLNTGGQVLRMLPVRTLPGSLPQIDLPLGSLAPAAYLLRITATADGSNSRASQLLSFSVGG
jgi:VWFA-related protein